MPPSQDETLTHPLATYWREARRPLASLVFVAPMLVAYEGGLLLLGPQAMRNGADVWLRQFLDWLGFGQYVLLPILTCSALLALHHIQRDTWQLRWSVPYGMFLECLVLGLALLVAAHVQGALMASLHLQAVAQAGAKASCTAHGTANDNEPLKKVPKSFPPRRPEPCETGSQDTVVARSWERLVAFIGAGIFEELLFRLLLLPAVALILQGCGVKASTSWLLAVVITSAMFAAAHYQFNFAVGAYQLATHAGEAFQWTSFLFRFVAGLFFAALFLYRGFGIAAGTHALYDILVFVL